MGVSSQRYAPAALYPGKMALCTHCTEGWVGPKACLDTELRVKVLLPLQRIDP
jgi:hypothetical protein